MQLLKLGDFWCSDSFHIVNILFLSEAHENFFNSGALHLLVAMIPVNNTQYCEKERTIGGHVTWTAFLMAAKL